ncbi:hypothetical protein BU23DRAFT_573893 [Bimuria novae-zelandiae CBS 107.79]|uniref:AA1-like domain-containing protein n=1 Tax=Bimuria novae-zelandiae CBS 107.79 TaxID=1447943 RepID=A0A6A5UPP5_9PLEO|nr:hypothetical protein BU23DRAFT_573893 [Bimuria novae-zelandiae CBS 107.79]
MLLSILTTFLLTSTAYTTPLHPRDTPTVVFTVTNFAAFMADPYIDGAQSNLTFHVADTRSGYAAEVDCVVPNTYFNLHAISALFDSCKSAEHPEYDFSYSYGVQGLTVQRGWRVNETTHVTGSGMQEWNWKEDGPGANVTAFPDGKLYVRKKEWLIPVTRMQAGTPP